MNGKPVGFDCWRAWAGKPDSGLGCQGVDDSRYARRACPLGIGDGEFDPGSERTLAARLKHASRADARLSGREEAADG